MGKNIDLCNRISIHNECPDKNGTLLVYETPESKIHLSRFGGNYLISLQRSGENYRETFAFSFIGNKSHELLDFIAEKVEHKEMDQLDFIFIRGVIRDNFGSQGYLWD